MNELIIKVKQLFPDMCSSERRIANYILTHQYELLKTSIKELAAFTNSSQATCVRFFQKLGYNGYKDVKKNISNSLVRANYDPGPDPTSYSDIKSSNIAEELCLAVYEQHIRSLKETSHILSMFELKKAVNAIRNATRIAFFGVGSSLIVAKDAQSKFVRLGLNAFAFDDVHMQLTFASIMDETSVAIIISNSGNTKDMIDVMDAAQRAGATIIAITGFGHSQLRKSADISLTFSTPETAVRSGAMGSRMATLMVIDYLFVCVANKGLDLYETRLNLSREALSLRHMAPQKYEEETP